MLNDSGLRPGGGTGRGPRSRGLAAKLFGDPSSVGLEHRIFCGIAFLAFCAGVFATIQNLLIGTSMLMVASAVVSGVAGGIGYWLARRMRRWRLLLVPSFVFFLVLFWACWATQAGSNGTIGYFFFLLVCYQVVFFKGARKIVSLVLTAATIVALLLVEYLVPTAILPYATPLQRFADVAFSLPLCLFMLAIFIHIVYGEYQRERKAKDELLRQTTAEKDRVERSMRQKQRLLTVVSHDIANALTILQGDISLIRISGRTDPSICTSSRMSSLERMSYACGNIAEIISSVRMMEAVEQGLIQFSPRAVDLQAVFRNAEVLFAERLAKRRICIQFPELTGENRFVMADAKILANHVFNNLISNAIKFSYPDSSIVVTVSREADSTMIRVSDRGMGMPPELVANLFDLDAMTTRPGTDGEPGTGFGLRTVKNFIDLFGGQIEISSAAETMRPDDHGTSVGIRLKSGPVASGSPPPGL
ncbi:MAG TPA: HAMP domain-containing sensor histidine kinase [Polyangia bacterium]